jgi:hypothetical protein
MSLHVWNTMHDRRNLIRVQNEAGFYMMYMHVHGADLSDSSSSSDTSSSDDDEFDMEIMLLDRVATAHRVANQHYEDGTIDFDAPPKMVADLDPNQNHSLDYRFRKQEIQEIADKLWPRMEAYFDGTKEKIRCTNGYSAPFETMLLVYLYRLHRPVRLRPDMEREFSIRKSKLSVMIDTFSRALYELAVQYLQDPAIWHHRMAHYAERIHTKTGGVIDNIWGFIDATIRRTCRPVYFQDVVYQKYIKGHGLKFQSIVTPDGFVACLHGPFPARRHDAMILRWSGILNVLRGLMPADLTGGPVYALYGDLAYPRCNWLLKGFRNAQANSPEALFNTILSSVRISVEWGYCNITRLWPYLDFKRGMQIFKSPVAQYYVNAAFLTNVANCLHDNATSDYFKCKSLSLDEYLALID